MAEFIKLNAVCETSDVGRYRCSIDVYMQDARQPDIPDEPSAPTEPVRPDGLGEIFSLPKDAPDYDERFADYQASVKRHDAAMAAHQVRLADYEAALPIWQTERQAAIDAADAINAARVPETMDYVWRDGDKGPLTAAVGAAVAAWIDAGEPLDPHVPFQPTAEQIKKEAERRILEIAPEWRQRNMTAAGVAMLAKMVDGTALTADEETAKAAYLATWNQIEAIRARSGAIEAMDPIPADYRDDRHWG